MSGGEVDLELLGEFVDRVLDGEEDRVLAEALAEARAGVLALLDRGEAIAAMRRSGRLGQAASEVLGWVGDDLDDLATAIEEGRP